ncbi:transposase [Orientia tsutsugamushi]|nr:transposase [Orientia tsutsugamushi]
MHYLKGEETGIYYIDSTKLAICHNKHIFSNRVFNKISKIGKSSYGWFLCFKLHLIINKMCYRKKCKGRSNIRKKKS